MTGYDIQSSVDLLCEERDKKARRIEQDRETQREIMEQRKYGKTPMNKAVDMQKLKGLSSVGFEKYLAAEALRINENDADKALDLLTNPEQNCILQSKIQSRRSRSSHGLGAGSSRSRAAAATTASGINNSQASVNMPPHVPDGNAMDGSHEQLVNNGEAVNNAVNNEQAVNHDDDVTSDEVAVSDEEANHHQPPVRDVLMENELANELTGDALDDYDIDVSNEGQAIGNISCEHDPLCAHMDIDDPSPPSLNRRRRMPAPPLPAIKRKTPPRRRRSSSRAPASPPHPFSSRQSRVGGFFVHHARPEPAGAPRRRPRIPPFSTTRFPAFRSGPPPLRLRHRASPRADAPALTSPRRTSSPALTSPAPPPPPVPPPPRLPLLSRPSCAEP